MEFAGDVAEARGIDPGKPSVADFGRRLYRSKATPSVESLEAASIAKKRRALFLAPRSNGDDIAHALRSFVERLERTPFTGLVVDYDGTLCATDRRREPPESNICEELNRLLGEGIALGVATGRGQSILKDLRRALDPHYWNVVPVGLYNGAKVVDLSNDVPESKEKAPISLASACSKMRPLQGVLGFEAILRPYQLSLRPHSGPDPMELRSVAMEQLAGVDDISIVASSHSVDIIPTGTSKTAVVDALRSKQSGCILRIGDQGAAGGNDFELLNTGLSLSVDRVSSSLGTCWNLGPPGLAGPALALQYLRALARDGEAFRIDVSGLIVGPGS